jgi:hypothetical protein
VLLDAISAYLPSPYEKSNEALDTAADEAKVVRVKQQHRGAQRLRKSTEFQLFGRS